MTRALFAAVLSLWLTTSAWAGFDEGVAAYDRGDYATAFEEMLPIAEQGHTEAQYNLGIMYKNGQGVPQDYAEAVKWYRLAVVQGHIDAQFNLGSMYQTGEGVPQDYVQAHMWFNLVAAKGSELARDIRDTVAKKMTPADVSKAQRLAREWLEKHGE